MTEVEISGLGSSFGMKLEVGELLAWWRPEILGGCKSASELRLI